MDVGIADELAPRAYAQESQLCLFSAVQWSREGKDITLLSLVSHHLWQSWPQGQESGITDHVSHRLQYSGEQPLHLALAAG